MSILHASNFNNQSNVLYNTISFNLLRYTFERINSKSTTCFLKSITTKENNDLILITERRITNYWY